MADHLFYELQKLLAENNTPDFPSIVPKERVNPQLLAKYTELHTLYLNKIKQINKEISEGSSSIDINDFVPYLYDFIHLPIECKNIEEIAKLLENEESINDSFFEKDVQEINLHSDFKTAGGNEIGDKKLLTKQDPSYDKESGLDSRILEKIKNEILDSTANVSWDDIAGLQNVKTIIKEIVTLPMLRPDIFTGLRAPPKGLLLFGPPGTGKTMIGKCIASQCKATFFSISASSLTSKWVGEGEKMVRGLFYLARKMQPSVVFIDEIDSLLSQRSDNENEASRKIKTEFLVQFDGAATNKEEKILIIGATNRPHEIDEAARRRLVKRIYVPLPDDTARECMLKHLMKDYKNILTNQNYTELVKMVDGYSGSDLFNLCRETVMEPIREIDDIENFDYQNTRPIDVNDFRQAMHQIRKSVSQKDLIMYEKWNDEYGSINK